MTTPTIPDRARQIIAEHLEIDPAKITDDAKFIDDLGADSLDTVEIVLALEEEFDIEIRDEDAENILTVGQAVKYVSDRLGAPA